MIKKQKDTFRLKSLNESKLYRKQHSVEKPASIEIETEKPKKVKERRISQPLKDKEIKKQKPVVKDSSSL